MGEFQEQVECIVAGLFGIRNLEENDLCSDRLEGLEGRIPPGKARDVFPEVVYPLAGGKRCNCYPGIPDSACHPLAIFISLKTLLPKVKAQLSFAEMMEKFLQHMQGHCLKITTQAILITDEWEGKIFEKWRPNIQQIKKVAHVEAYLVTGLNVSNIRI